MTLYPELERLVAERCDGKPGAEIALSRFAEHADDPAAAWRIAAVRFHGAARHSLAAEAQQCAIATFGDTANASPDDRTFLAELLLQAGRPDEAEQVLRALLNDAPEFLPARLKQASLAAAKGVFGAAATHFRAILADHPDNVFALDGLARAAGWTRNFDEAREAGRKSLALKDAMTASLDRHWQIDATRAPRYDPARPERNILAFSLWGSEPRYLDTLAANVVSARDLYPSWRCRIYCDRTVPATSMTNLRSMGAQIVLMPTPAIRHAGRLWRFLAADDPDVDRVLFRDADSPLTVRERVAVDDWIASDKPFHVMRDWWSHTDLVLAGMWGAAGGHLTGLARLMEAYLAKVSVPNRHIDQQFLAGVVWPVIRNHVLTHDDLFGALGARPFPPYGRLPKGQHVGMNASAFDPDRHGK